MRNSNHPDNLNTNVGDRPGCFSPPAPFTVRAAGRDSIGSARRVTDPRVQTRSGDRRQPSARPAPNPRPHDPHSASPLPHGQRTWVNRWAFPLPFHRLQHVQDRHLVDLADSSAVHQCGLRYHQRPVDGVDPVHGFPVLSDVDPDVDRHCGGSDGHWDNLLGVRNHPAGGACSALSPEVCRAPVVKSRTTSPTQSISKVAASPRGCLTPTWTAAWPSEGAPIRNRSAPRTPSPQGANHPWCIPAANCRYHLIDAQPESGRLCQRSGLRSVRWWEGRVGYPPGEQ
jgi:hypothetical protein